MRRLVLETLLEWAAKYVIDLRSIGPVLFLENVLANVLRLTASTSLRVEQDTSRQQQMSEEEYNNTGGLQVGDTVVCRHGEGTLVSMSPTGECEVTYGKWHAA